MLASYILTIAAAAGQGSGEGGLVSLRWVPGANLTVGGRGFNGTASFWNRLPASAGSPSAGINPGVYGLSKDSAGMSVRFSTNSPVCLMGSYPGRIRFRPVRGFNGPGSTCNPAGMSLFRPGSWRGWEPTSGRTIWS